ncbi:MAG TPA: cupin domain-containing protein [Pirellulaceae bacterium]|jgi:quercetin dioxygenase-like cupin family protein|nr:cupin domain-containing protein [Pirellulaceae bacterium]
MKVNNVELIEQKPVEMDGASGCKIRSLLGEPDGTPTFAMRQFEVAPGGHTPKHHHPYEHEVFVLEGNGMVIEGDVEHPLAPGDVVFVNPDDIHQFRNTGDSPLKFLCLIPNSARGKTVTVVSECGLDKSSNG